MKSFIESVRQHAMYAACAAAVVVVFAAVVFDLPVLGILAVLFCGTMMVGMVWMMVGMAVKHGHSPWHRK